MEIRIDTLEVLHYLWICLSILLATQLIIVVADLAIKVTKAVIPLVIAFVIAIYKVLKALLNIPSYWLAVFFWAVTVYIYVSDVNTQALVEQLQHLPLS